MFCYQLSYAVSKLIDPPVVDVEEDLKINDFELPMITVCPTQQFNLSVLENYGYRSYDYFIKGSTINHKAGNKTFWDIVNESLIYSLEHDVDIKYEEDSVWIKTFLPKYGFCWNLVNYTYSKEIIVKTETLIQKTGPMVVLLTDKDLRTDYDLHLASQRGENIEIKINNSGNYYIEVEKLSYYDPTNETACKSFAAMEYAKCVDNDVLDSRIKRLNYTCNPPWLKIGKMCNDMTWKKKPQLTGYQLLVAGMADILTNEEGVTYRLSLDHLIEMENIDAKRACPTPCTVLLSKIRQGTSKSTPDSEIRLVFDDYVSYRHKVINYHFTDFLVDIGSSVGLWFGLSVFGLADLGIQLTGYLRVCCGFGSK